MAKPSDAREKLLKVAIDLISRQSYRAVSVDQICEKAAVAKGSFYHFFPSKSALACAAFDEQWKDKQPQLDAIFSPQVPPLERIRKYCESVYKNQRTMRDSTGFVCGCPFAALGSELSTQDEDIRLKAVERFDRLSRYFESALRDAQAEGLIEATDLKATADAMYSMVLGMQLQGKVRNDLEFLRAMEGNLLRLIGVRESVGTIS
jgi:TetR/AcrR family transcriptional repressor of nem operon